MPSKSSILVVIFMTWTASGCAVFNANNQYVKDIMTHFYRVDSMPWVEVFNDPCAEDWKQKWMLDGRHATITHSSEGMDFAAGPLHRDDSQHAVLWTRQSFTGDIKIEYEYTKLDDTAHCVTVLYVMAAGSGDGEFTEDISKWNHLREVASMGMYFNHMNTYHVSYAAYGVENTDPSRDYIRARRYMPSEGQGLKETSLPPDHVETGLFKTGVPHQITLVKQGRDLYMHIRNHEQEKICHWRTDAFPPINEGRIGLRHMYTRCSRYRDFRVFELATQ